MTDSVPDSAPHLTASEAGPRLPRQRWRIPVVNSALVDGLTQSTGLSPLLAQVLIQRGIVTPDLATDFLNPERQQLPSPLVEFPDLAVSLELLVEAIETGQAIAICGDYDADGMTSTALLLRALRILGAKVSYTIPSRMSEGYGINQRIVEDCYADGVSLILTVDNGIAALAPVERARELGLAVIVTDHHDIPPQLPPANAILNPKLLSEFSPYRGVAGVGVAYILAVCLAQALDKTQDLTAPLLELFTLGTIADLAPLTGVNRRWVRRGLGLLPRSRILGIQALIQVAGLADQSKPLKPEHIGFRLGPRINAVGRISDPQIVIDLLTTDDVGTALERAMQCEQINATRQELCQQIEQEAVAWCEQQQQSGTLDLAQERVLLVVQPQWHHGVIGIVASRLVERYGVPVFIGTYEDEDQRVIRGSARGIPEFDVFEALQSSGDLMEKFGGHRAAGGFSFLAKHLRQVKSRLVNYACQQLTPDLLKPVVAVDAQARLSDLSQALYNQIDHLHPCGIENPDPVFWTPQVRVLEQQVVGRNREHLKLVLSEGDGGATIKAIAWRWGEYYPLPSQLDVAYKLKENEWQGVSSVELELVGVRLAASQEPGNQELRAHQPIPVYRAAASGPSLPEIPLAPAAPVGSPPTQGRSPAPSPPPPPTDVSQAPANPTMVVVPLEREVALDPSVSTPVSQEGVEFGYSQRRYWASYTTEPKAQQFTISNPEGQLLQVSLANRQGFLCLPGEAPKPIDITESHYANLVQLGFNALEIQRLTQGLRAKEAQLAEQDGRIQALSHQLAQLQARVSDPTPTPMAQALQPEPTQPEPLPTELPSPVPAKPEPVIMKATTPAVVGSPAAVDSSGLRQQVRVILGDPVWFCLAAPTQTLLLRAFQPPAVMEAPGAKASPGDDYSTAALALVQALEGEILVPLIEGFTEYSQQTDDDDLATLATGLAQRASLGTLPPLLAETWKALTDKALQATTKPRKVYQTISAEAWVEAGGGLGDPIDDTHRVLLDEFLQGWDHPVALWMTTANEDAATGLALVHQLAQVALETARPLPHWQYQLLQQRVLGDRRTVGLFAKIFGEAAQST